MNDPQVYTSAELSILVYEIEPWIGADSGAPVFMTIVKRERPIDGPRKVYRAKIEWEEIQEWDVMHNPKQLAFDASVVEKLSMRCNQILRNHSKSTVSVLTADAEYLKGQNQKMLDAIISVATRSI